VIQRIFFGDAREATDVIAAVTAGKTFAEFERDIVLRSAVEQFEIVGEALSRLSRTDAALAQRIPGIGDIIGFRNVLIHGYATVDRVRVWRAI
jgi:uncharacterized protein with HEPN domain